MGAIEEDDEASTDLDGSEIILRTSTSSIKRQDVQVSRGLRLVDGRLQVVGFAPQSQAKVNPSKPRIRARSQKSFWNQVMFYVLK
jgi:hypothetical protein